MKFMCRSLMLTFGILSTYTTYAQDYIKQSINQNRKNLILQSIKPPLTIEKPKQAVSNQNEDLELYRKFLKKDGGESFDDKFHVDSTLITISKEQLFKTEPGGEVKAIVYDGKIRLVPVKDTDRRLDKMSLRKKLEGVTLRHEIGGLNLSGFKEKKLSKKTIETLKALTGDTPEE